MKLLSKYEAATFYVHINSCTQQETTPKSSKFPAAQRTISCGSLDFEINSSRGGEGQRPIC